MLFSNFSLNRRKTLNQSSLGSMRASFSCLAPVTCFPWRRLHAFPRLAPVTCFPWHRSHVFPGTGCMLSRAWHRLHVNLRLAPVACFLALGTDGMFSRSCHWFHLCHTWQVNMFSCALPWF